MDAKFLQDGFEKQLAHLVEECGEVLAAAGKTQRHGRLSYNPYLEPSERETNEEWLLREINDLNIAIARLKCTIAEIPKESNHGLYWIGEETELYLAPSIKDAIEYVREQIGSEMDDILENNNIGVIYDRIPIPSSTDWGNYDKKHQVVFEAARFAAKDEVVQVWSAYL